MRDAATAAGDAAAARDTGLAAAAADLGARTLVAYADLPIGMLTSLVGGPFFFWLLRRARRRCQDRLHATRQGD